VSKEKDILQIRKYLNGELDARAMHELERRALDDPFLMEALQGYEQTAGNQKSNLDELSARLQQRIAKKEARIIPWRMISVAASVLIVIGAGVWFLSDHQPVQMAKMAENIRPEQKTKPSAGTVKVGTASKVNESNDEAARAASPTVQANSDNAKAKRADISIAEYKKSTVANQPDAVAAAPAEEPELYRPKKDSIAPNELAVDAARDKKNLDAVKKTEAVAKAKQFAPTETLLRSKAEGVSVSPDNVIGNSTHPKTLNGVVIGGDDGQPITGATVKVIGRPFGVVTDANGKFTLPDVNDNQTLSVNYIGYNAKKVKVSKSDSMSISLDPANSALAEVVVTQAVEKNGGEAASTDAHPKNGMSNVDDYLKKNAVSPDGKTGKVKLSFVVATDGTLSQFKVLKSLSDAADKKAIDLLSKGPEWVGAADKKPKEVKVTVSFHQ
jgi:hypothetical protein